MLKLKRPFKIRAVFSSCVCLRAEREGIKERNHIKLRLLCLHEPSPLACSSALGCQPGRCKELNTCGTNNVADFQA